MPKVDAKNPRKEQKIKLVKGRLSRLLFRWWSKLSAWWIGLTTTTKAVFAALGAVAFAAVSIQTIAAFYMKLFAPSHTSFIVQGASSDEIRVVVRNDGGNSSTVLNYRLSFANMPIESRALRVIDEDDTKVRIPPSQDVVVRLKAAGLRPDLKTGSIRFTKSEITTLMPEGVAILEADVEESDGFYTHCYDFNASRIEAFIKKKVPDYEHP